MRRIISLVVVALVMAAMMLAMAMPAFADKGGDPADNSCGLGKDAVHSAQENPRSPGASEAAHVPPGHPGEENACTGKG